MMQPPLVSVIIPSYNSAHFLPAAVESVRKQTFTDHEILVIDDGSTDQTEELMKGYGPEVRYIRQVNGGVSKARNRGITESRGRFVAFLDADDTWRPDKIERQIEQMRAHPQLRLCYSAFARVDADLRVLGVSRSPRRTHVLEDLLLCGNVVGSICTVLCERSLFNSAGGFDPELSQCADWDMWVRLATMTDFLYLDEPLVTYRQHDGNMSRNAPLMERDSVRVLDKGFALPDLPATIRAARQRAYARNYTVLAGTYLRAGQYGNFARCACKAILGDVRQLGYFLAFPLRVARRRLQPN